MGCKDTVLPDPLLKNHSVKCLTFDEKIRKPYKDNLCLFRALALNLHGNEVLEEETSKLSNLFLDKSGGSDPANFRGVSMEDIAAVEDFVRTDVLLFDVDFVDGSMIDELARRSTGKHQNCRAFTLNYSHLPCL